MKPNSGPPYNWKGSMGNYLRKNIRKAMKNTKFNFYEVKYKLLENFSVYAIFLLDNQDNIMKLGVYGIIGITLTISDKFYDVKRVKKYLKSFQSELTYINIKYESAHIGW